MKKSVGRILLSAICASAMLFGYAACSSGSDSPAPISKPEKPNKGQTVTNPDGSTTTTVVNKDGSVTVTTVSADKSSTSSTTTVTNADGSKVETTTVTNTDGSSANIKKETAADGAVVESKSEVAADGAITVTETKVSVEGAVEESKTETSADGLVTKTDTKIDVDGSKEEVKQEIAADGSIKETKTETAVDGTATETTTEIDKDGNKGEPVVVTKYTVRYVADDEVVAEFVDVIGTAITAPAVPAKEKHAGAWDKVVTSIEGNAVVTAVYTSVGDANVNVNLDKQLYTVKIGGYELAKDVPLSYLAQEYLVYGIHYTVDAETKVISLNSDGVKFLLETMDAVILPADGKLKLDSSAIGTKADKVESVKVQVIVTPLATAIDNNDWWLNVYAGETYVAKVEWKNKEEIVAGESDLYEVEITDSEAIAKFIENGLYLVGNVTGLAIAEVDAEFVTVPLVPATFSLSFKNKTTDLEGKFEGTSGSISDSTGGLTIDVDATVGKLSLNGDNAQFNTGTKIAVPVNNEGDKVTVETYSGYGAGNIKVGTLVATGDVTEYTVTAAEALAGVVVVEATGNSYLYSITLDTQIPYEERFDDSWDFTELAANPESPIAGANGNLTLVKGASQKATNFTKSTVLDSDGTTVVANGLILRSNSSTPDAAYIDFSDIEDTYVVHIELYNNSGNATKVFHYDLGDGTVVTASDVMNETKDVYTLDVEVTGQKFTFGGTGTDAFIIQKITVTKKAN